MADESERRPALQVVKTEAAGESPPSTVTEAEDFADAPKSLAERRAYKQDDDGDARLLPPRDALVALLREIDRGEVDVDQLVVAYYAAGEADDFSVGYRVAGPETATFTVGMLERVKALILSS